MQRSGNRGREAREENGMKGWKTWAGAALVGAAAAARALGYEAVSEVLLLVGASLGIVDMAHKIEKIKED